MRFTLRKDGEERGWPGHLFWGRMRTSTFVLIVAFFGAWWLFNTYKPVPPPPVPETQVVPPGFVPDPAYTWVPRTYVQDRPRTTTPTTTTETSPTETTETTPTSPDGAVPTTLVDPDGPGPLPATPVSTTTSTTPTTPTTPTTSPVETPLPVPNRSGTPTTSTTTVVTGALPPPPA